MTVIDNSRQAVYGYDQRVEAFGSARDGRVRRTRPPTPGLVRTKDGTQAATLPYFFLERYVAELPARVGGVRRGLASGGPPLARGGADGRAPLAIGLAATRSLHREGRPVRSARSARCASSSQAAPASSARTSSRRPPRGATTSSALVRVAPAAPGPGLPVRRSSTCSTGGDARRGRGRAPRRDRPHRDPQRLRSASTPTAGGVGALRRRHEHARGRGERPRRRTRHRLDRLGLRRHAGGGRRGDAAESDQLLRRAQDGERAGHARAGAGADRRADRGRDGSPPRRTRACRAVRTRLRLFRLGRRRHRWPAGRPVHGLGERLRSTSVATPSLACRVGRLDARARGARAARASSTAAAARRRRACGSRARPRERSISTRASSGAGRRTRPRCRPRRSPTTPASTHG